MEEKLSHSLTAAKKEYKEEPMIHFYNNKIAGWPSRYRVKKVLAELGDISGKKILDIGCEAGYVSFKLLKKNPSHLYAIDIVDEALEEFKKKLKLKKYKTQITLKKAFLQSLPFKENLFDFMVCTEVIEHAPDIDAGFSEMSRVLKKGGKLVLTFPNEKLRKKVYWLPRMFGINTDIEKEVTLFEYKLRDIVKKLKDKKFSIKKAYRLPWFFPITYMVVCEKIA